MPAKRSGRPLAAAISATDSEDVVVASLLFLGDRLHHDLGVRQLVQVGDHLGAFLELVLRLFGGLRPARPEHDFVRLVGSVGEAAGDRPAPDYSEPHRPQCTVWRTG
jgi:hypothetical protein